MEQQAQASATAPTTGAPRAKQRLARALIQLALIGQLAALSARAAMNLPDGIEHILGFVPRSSFQCERDGYFGDTDNDCRIFHLCQRQVSASGRTEWRHWTYACGNQTMFNQLTLTCAFVDEAIPCKHASQFQYLNEVINRPSEPFLTDADVTSGLSYYSNRIMSDGARARAFQDASLMAQLGGGALGAAGQLAARPAQWPTSTARPEPDSGSFSFALLTSHAAAGEPAPSTPASTPVAQAPASTEPSQAPAEPATSAAPPRSAGRRALSAAFQSSRLAALRRQQQQQPALVMRKRSGRAANSQHHQPRAADFRPARQPAELAFEAPSFESLVVRRRV